MTFPPIFPSQMSHTNPVRRVYFVQGKDFVMLKDGDARVALYWEYNTRDGCYDSGIWKEKDVSIFDDMSKNVSWSRVKYHPVVVFETTRECVTWLGSKKKYEGGKWVVEQDVPVQPVTEISDFDLLITAHVRPDLWDEGYTEEVVWGR